MWHFPVKSSSIKQVFETRVSKTRDASLLKPFKRVLTYYFVLLIMLVCKIPQAINALLIGLNEERFSTKQGKSPSQINAFLTCLMDLQLMVVLRFY